MANRLTSMVLAVSCLGWCALAVAQPPAPPPNPGLQPGFFAPLVVPVVPDAPPVMVANETQFSAPTLSIGFEYLLWYTRKQALPPLVTSGSLTDPIPGALGQPNTRVLLAGNDGRDGPNSGGKLTLGLQLDENLIVTSSGFFFQETSGRNVVSSTGASGSAVLARPFFNGNANVEDADPIAVPNTMSGTFTVQLPRRFYGGDVDLRWIYLNEQSQNYRLTIVTGARFLQLDEKIAISERLQDLPGLGTAGNSYSLSETFSTRNSFYGGQFGLDYQWNLGPVFIGLTGTVAAGTTHQADTNTANTQIREPDGTVTVGLNRALLVQPSNAGKRSKDVFSVVPESSFKLGFALNEHIQLGFGYNILYWTGVARPANVIDRAVNLQALQPFDQVGPARPGPILSSTSFWAQGVTANLGFTF